MILLYMGILQGREGLKQSNSFCLVNFLAGEEKLGGGGGGMQKGGLTIQFWWI